MARQQSIRVYSDKLDLLTETDVYQSLMFERSYHNIGEFEIHINRYMQGAEHFVRGNVISIGKNGYKGGIIHTQEIELDELGRETETFIVKGESLDSIMSRRITIPPAGKSHDRITASAEEVMKHYVQANFINATDTDRILERFKVADIRGLGEKITWESRYRNIANELNDISVRTNVGWGVYVDFETRMFVFDVFQAKDLTKGNDEGNSPVFFSPEFDSIKSQRFIDSEADYKNVAYIGGQGEGVERRVVQLNEDVGWERYEEFVDARDIGDKDEETDKELTEEEIDQLLAKRGTEKLADLGRLLSLEAEIITPIANRSTFQYERDYDLGDKVEVYNRSWGLTMEAPIVKVTEIYEEGGFTLEATFGEDRPTFLTKIKRRFDRLEGVDMQEAPDKVAVKRMNESKEHTDQEIHKTVEYVDEQDDKYDKKATDYTNQETERTLQEAVTEAVRQDELVRQDAMAAAQKAEENAISKSVAKEIYNAQVDEILKSLDDVDGVVTQQNVRIGEVSDKVTGFEVKINKYDGKFVSYDETINELEGKVTTSIEKVEGFGNKVEANTTEITKQAGMIAAKLDETTYTKDKDGIVKDIASNKAEIEATAKEVSSKVSRDEFDELEIGGRNLLKDSLLKMDSLSQKYNIANLEITDKALQEGEPTVITIKGDLDSKLKCFKAYNTVGNAPSVELSYLGNGIHRWVGKWFYSANDSTEPNTTLRLYQWPSSDIVDGSSIEWVKLEKGTHATDWTPAPEDVDSRIDHAETEIKQNADEIALRATKDEVDKERTKINKAQADITANADAIKLRATTTQLNTEKKRITNAEGRIDVLDNAVKLKASQEDVDGLAGRVTKAEGELKVLPGEISAKVSKDGVISAINLTKEKAKIQAAQIDLVGAVTANHIKSLSGLNVNDQFIVSPSGNVTFGGDLKGASGTFGNVTVLDGDFKIRDSSSSAEYTATPKRNLIKDHSFEMVAVKEIFTQWQHDHRCAQPDVRDYDNWEYRGEPKVAVQLWPEEDEKLPLIGDKAIVVKNANFVRQTILEGVAGGKTYTMSGHFKRQWGLAGGKPRFEVDLLEWKGTTQKRTRLINKIFNNVPADYTPIRHAATFTLPKNIEVESYLEVKISAGDDNWVQCDGVQLTEGSKASVYQPEDSAWQIAKGKYPVLSHIREYFWIGEYYPMANHTIKPRKKLEDCRNGWVIQWGRYVKGDGSRNSHYQYTFIPKQHRDSPYGMSLGLGYSEGVPFIRKYIYVTNEEIKGNAANNQGNSHNLVIRSVFEW